ncbi:hypothetical protein TNCV_4389681 [Trichonephila clavipes]|nr:hypothetical protein TNCV_4389681 [Trichonephila clavipes]
MYSSALSIEIISDVEFSRRLLESRSDKLKQVKSSKIKANAGEKQLNSSVGTKQLNSTGENNSTHERNNMNETTQQEKTTQLSSRNEQLNSPAGTKQLNSVLPSTACNRLHRLYSRIGFFYLLP